jgi:hypothetical protein
LDKLPALPEAARFLGNLLIATRRGVVPWQPAEDNDETVEAVLPSGYHVILTLVPDFSDDASVDPDHVLEVRSNGRHLFSMDRREIDLEALRQTVGEEYNYPYTVFAELWSRARMSSARVDDHLKALNAILTKDLSG